MGTCKDAIDLLRSYLDGDLSVDERAHLEEHLDDCAPCVDFLKTYRATPGLCREVLRSKMPDALAKNLADYLRANLKKQG